MNQRGFAPLILILIVGAIIVMAGGGFWYSQKSIEQNKSAVGTQVTPESSSAPVEKTNQNAVSKAPTQTAVPTKPAPAQTPTTSCPANTHQDPSDSTKCLCDSGYQTNSAGNGCIVASVPPPNATFDIKISSFTCTHTDVQEYAGSYPYTLTYARAIMNGMAQGPVGAEARLNNLVWATDKADCGTWTYTNYDKCVRENGQPETTTWSVDTGGDAQASWLIGTTLSRTFGIYKNGVGDPQKEDSRSTVCQ